MADEVIIPEIVIDAVEVPERRANKPRLSLNRTNEYIKASGIDKMTAEEMIDFLRNQSSIKIALLGDQLIKHLEMLDQCADYIERNSLSLTIAALTKAAAEISEMRNKFEKAVGVGVPQRLASFEANRAAPKEMTADEFANAYEEATRASGTIPTPPAQA